MRRPPLASSCSRTPIFSRACMTLRSTEPEASTWCEGREPRFLVELFRELVSYLASVCAGVPSDAAGAPHRGELRGVCVPVDLAETANTDGLAHVDVAGDGGGANVEPVNVLRGQLVGVYSALDDGVGRGMWFRGAHACAHARAQCEGDVREVLTVSTQPVDKRSAS